MAIKTKITQQIAADVGTTTSLPTFARKRVVRQANDPVQCIIVACTGGDWELRDEQKKNGSYEITIVYFGEDGTISENDTTEDIIETISNLYEGFKDLIVTGVTIEDVEYGGTDKRIPSLTKKGLDYIASTYTVTTIEDRK